MRYFFTISALCSILSAQTALLLPHQWHETSSYLAKMITNDNRSLTIISTSFDERGLKKALLEAVKRGKSIVIMSGSVEMAAKMAIYKGVDVCMLRSYAHTPLTFSIVRSGSESCLLTTSLSRDSLRAESGIMSCVKDDTYKKIILELKDECDRYLLE